MVEILAVLRIAPIAPIAPANLGSPDTGFGGLLMLGVTSVGFSSFDARGFGSSGEG